MSTAGVVIPYRPDGPERAAALAWVRDRYRAAGLEPVVARMRRSDEPWIKAHPVAAAVATADADVVVVVVADADVWTDHLDSAIRAVTCGVAAWAVPHRVVRRLSREATSRVLAGAEPFAERDYEDDGSGQPGAYDGIPGGGIVVGLRETLLEVPLDPRFAGWGQEDEAWGVALTTLAGEPWRSEHPLVHLWHPHPPRLNRRQGSPESWALLRRYAAARSDRRGMQALISEIDH